MAIVEVHATNAVQNPQVLALTSDASPSNDVVVADEDVELEEISDSGPETHAFKDCDRCNFKSTDDQTLVDHVEQSHTEFYCDECEHSFLGLLALEGHKSMKHSKRGAKRNRPETSLIFDERSCSKCDQLSQENSQLKTHTSSLQVTVSETADKANALTKDIANKETTISELKTEINSLKNDHTPNINNDLKKRNEEYELIKQMVVERDKTIKKLQENHKKDIQNLSLEKEALGDELNRVTEENPMLKD